MSGGSPLPTRTLDRCPSCGSDRLRPMPFRYEFRGTFPAVECGVCHLRFLRVQPSIEGLAELYGSSYFERDFRCGRSESDYFSEDAFREENRGLLDEFARLMPPGRLLEIGCAGGWLLKHASERGWAARGVELSTPAVEHAHGLGLEVFRGSIEDARLPSATFDLVYMGDVLEHVPDCRSTLLEVTRVLRPEGLLYLRGPITTHSLARQAALSAYAMAGRVRVLREPPYHLWEFTPVSLRRLFVGAGLAVVRMRESKIPPGRPHGAMNGAERALLHALDAVNVPLTRAFNAFGDRVVAIGRKR